MQSYIPYLAARWCQKQASRLAKQLPGIRKAEDIEYVHRARVASRRLRAAFDLFVDWPSPPEQKRWRKHIRRVGRSLGAARDRDVQLLFLCDRWPEIDSCSVRVGLSHLILRWEAQREVLQKEVVRTVDRLEQSGVLQEIQKRCVRILKKNAFSEEELRRKTLWEEAVRQVQEQMEAVWSFAPCLDDPEDAERHHAMRIAVKHLRYTLEILTPVLGKEIHSTIEDLQTFQTLMGQVHDCDVWQAQLADLQNSGLDEDFVGGRRKQKKKRLPRVWGRVEAAIRYLQENRSLARRQFFEEAAAHWRRRLQAEMGDRLEALVQKASLRSDVGEQERLAGPGDIPKTTGPFHLERSLRRDSVHQYKIVH